MALHQPLASTALSSTPLASGTTAPAKEASQPGRFGQVLAQLSPEAASVKVQRGDTLIGLVKAQHRQQGQSISDHRAYHLAHQIAADNRIKNPDLIRPGQKIDLGRLNQSSLANSPPRSTSSALDAPLATQTALEQLRPTSNTPPGLVKNSEHPVLDQVLQRAAGKGFIPNADLSQVRDKILQLADKHKFAPDDFARLSLLESGGMNPQASNGHCHGVIQFCDGPARGAAAVGYGNKPQAILGMSLLRQLDLVDTYFSKVGMPNKPEKQGLDELYLAILSPAARQERRPDAPLPIAGPQAHLLHVDRDTRNPITRNSLIAGLQAVTERVLSPVSTRKSPAHLYAEVANPAPSDSAE